MSPTKFPRSNLRPVDRRRTLLLSPSFTRYRPWKVSLKSLLASLPGDLLRRISVIDPQPETPLTDKPSGRIGLTNVPCVESRGFSQRISLDSAPSAHVARRVVWRLHVRAATGFGEDAGLHLAPSRNHRSIFFLEWSPNDNLRQSGFVAL
jgi:hypothetical protein